MDYIQELEKCIPVGTAILAARLRDCTSAARVYQVQLRGEGEERQAIKLYTKGTAPPPVLAHLIGRHSPHLVRIHAVGTNNPTFLRMELCPQDLRDLMRSGPLLSSQQALRIVRQITEGILYLKSLKMMHGDLKPENILIDGKGRAKLADLDFVLREEEFLHRELRVGTLQYMAPEVLGQWQCSYSSDVWSLGVIMHQLYFGRSPFPEIQQLDPSKQSSILNAHLILKKQLTPLRTTLTHALASATARPDRALLTAMLGCLEWEARRRVGVEEVGAQAGEGEGGRKGSWSTDYSSIHHEDDIFMFPNTGLLLALQQLRNILSLLPEETSKYMEIVTTLQRIAEGNGEGELSGLREMVEVKYRRMERNFKRLAKSEGGVGYSSRGQLFSQLHYLRELLGREEGRGGVHSAETLPQ